MDKVYYTLRDLYEDQPPTKLWVLRDGQFREVLLPRKWPWPVTGQRTKQAPSKGTDQ